MNDLVPGCDAPESPVYILRMEAGRPVYGCRCMVCPRCAHHTGNNTQGHYWSWCHVTKSGREFHLCCPGDCELEETKPE